MVKLPDTSASTQSTSLPTETTSTAKPVAKAEGSPKKKTNRGCPEDWKTTWVSYDMSPDEHARLTKVAKHRDVKMNDLFVDILKNAIEQYSDEFDNDVAAYDASPNATKSTKSKVVDFAKLTPEQAQATAEKRMAAAKTSMANAEAMLAAMRAAAASGVLGSAVAPVATE